MIEGERGKGRRDLGAAGHDRDFLGREILRGELGHQRAGALGEFARLDHRPVARGEHLHQRTEGELHREVPGAEDADHALGLVTHLGLGTHQPERELHLALFGLRPGIDMLQGVPPRADRRGDVGEHRLVHRPAAEIGAHRLGEFLPMVLDQRNGALDPVLPLRDRLGARGREGSALARQQGFEFFAAVVGHVVLPFGHLRFDLRRVVAQSGRQRKRGGLVFISSSSPHA